MRRHRAPDGSARTAGALDPDAAGAHAAALVRGGCDGLVLSGTTGGAARLNARNARLTGLMASGLPGTVTAEAQPDLGPVHEPLLPAGREAAEELRRAHQELLAGCADARHATGRTAGAKPHKPRRRPHIPALPCMNSRLESAF
ncbi:hypothetical protein [Streptomyces sp. NPDC008125]|uniref:hypothetical protein n=1 Tax=Streptomyces sp. NPDC008125 TaxID=3364811 RepID=UPI0036EB1E80